MEKFKINNIYNDDSKTLMEIMSNFLSLFLDDDFKDIVSLNS